MHGPQKPNAVAAQRPRPPWMYDGPLTDQLRNTTCPTCHQPVAEALACGILPTQIDPVRLTPTAELKLRLAGGTTLRIWPDPPVSSTRRLAFRDTQQILAHPGRGVPRHQCGRYHGPPDPDITGMTRRRKGSTQCPF